MKIFCSNLPDSYTEDHIRKLFEQYGSVAAVRLMYSKRHPRSYGYAYVYMENNEQAAKAVLYLNGREVDGKVLSVDRVAPR